MYTSFGTVYVFIVNCTFQTNVFIIVFTLWSILMTKSNSPWFTKYGILWQCKWHYDDSHRNSRHKKSLKFILSLTNYINTDKYAFSPIIIYRRLFGYREKIPEKLYDTLEKYRETEPLTWVPAISTFRRYTEHVDSVRNLPSVECAGLQVN